MQRSKKKMNSLNQHVTCSYFNTLENRQKRSSDRGTALGGRQSLGPGNWWPPVEAPGYGGRRLAGRGAGAADGLGRRAGDWLRHCICTHLEASAAPQPGCGVGRNGGREETRRAPAGAAGTTARQRRRARTPSPPSDLQRSPAGDGAGGKGGGGGRGATVGRSRSDRGYGGEVSGVDVWAVGPRSL